MKFTPLAALAVLLCGAATCVVLAAAPADSKAGDQSPAATQPASPSTRPGAAAPAASSAAPVNKKCPVSGDDVDPKGKTIVYKGKTIGFCCNDCIDLFNKNPDKYADKIK